MNASRTTNLHTMWDTSLIDVRIQRDFQSRPALYYNYLLQLMKNQSVPSDDDQIDLWINENMKLVCSQVYLDEQNATMNRSMNFSLGEVYYQRNIPVIEQRLASGGRRLGVILNRLAANRPEPLKEGLCTGTIVLIIVLSIQAVLALVIGAICCYRRSRSKASPPLLS
jgi:hypothetical protein